MRILFFNWKDTKHPLSGGAEIVTQAFAQELVKKGHQVTLFTSQNNHLPKTENISGVKIVRNGNNISVYLKAFLFYLKNQNNYDIVIDQFHGIPFFTPLYIKKPILAYIHEVALDIWFKEFSFSFALFGYIFEKISLLFYKNITFLTDTKSMAQILKTHGLNSKIHVLPLTIEPHPQLNIPKSKEPLILYFGRITPMKRIEIILETVKIINNQQTNKLTNLRIIIAGKDKPNYKKYLKNLTHKYHLEPQVKFIDHVSDSQKYKLFRKSWLQILPSVKEGFGLTILEAATQSTPTIAFKVPGLINTIENGKNGYLVSDYNPYQLANMLITLLNDKRKLKNLQTSTLKWSQKLPKFSNLTQQLEYILQNIIKDFA